MRFLEDEKADIGLVFKVIVGVVVGVAVLGLLLSMLNVVSFGTNKFVVEFEDKLSSGLKSDGSCKKDIYQKGWKKTGGQICLDGDDTKTFYICGIVKNERGGYVENAQVEISGAGAQDLVITDKNGRFALKADFSLGGTPFGTATISFKKDDFVRKDITIAVKKNC